ncbi:MAG: trypsin-like peptidase domain-containing protein [Clostridia bacterium]|nr:trypsin-like peptidase domain-containing protein [Clostridia bacterium]
MKKHGLFLISFCLLCSGCTLSTNQNLDTSVDMTPRLIATSEIMDSAQIADTVKSAIVGISAGLANGSSIGSGVAIADGGYILTNFHVISGAKSITLYFADKSTASANYVWGDSSIDIAILRSAKNLPYLDTAPLENVEVGDDVLAVGTPLSLQFQHTFTKGIVSALNRTIEIPSLGGYTTYMQNLIQHDASINSGNSGGPLINTQGKVIGINSLKASDAEGIGFAIPIETATAVANKIIKTGEFKQVYLGVFGQDALLAKFNQETTEESGVYVVDIDPNSPLSNTSLKKGDIITKINGAPIKNTLDMRKAIYALSPDEKVEIEFKSPNAESASNVVV